MRDDKTYLFHSDAGHGWLQVERSELKDLKIDHLVTAFSFERGKDVYLEEDYDLWLFNEAYKEKFGKKPMIIEPSSSMWVDYSPIRDFDMYKPTAKVNLTKTKIVVK